MEYSNDRITQLIKEFVHNDRDRDIVYMHYVHGMTYVELARRHKLSEKQVYRIARGNFKKLIKYL